MAAAGEPVDVADVAGQSGGAGWADSVELQQVAAGGVDEFCQLPVGGLDLLVDRGELGDEFGGQLPTGASDDVTRADGGQQCPGLRGG